MKKFVIKNKRELLIIGLTAGLVVAIVEVIRSGLVLLFELLL